MKSVKYLVVIILALLMVGNAQADAIYSIVDDFSTTANTDASIWSYRYSNDKSRDGNYQLLPSFSSTGIWSPSTSYWNTNSNGLVAVPGIGVNKSGDVIKYVVKPSSYFEWPNNTVWMHPGSSGLTIVGWHTHKDVSIDIDFLFSDIDTKDAGDDGIKWFIDLNAGDLAFGTLNKGQSSGNQSLHNIKLAAGDDIYFIVDPNGNYYSDSTAVTATIKEIPVPEPSTLLLLATGLLLLLSALTKQQRDCSGR